MVRSRCALFAITSHHRLPYFSNYSDGEARVNSLDSDETEFDQGLHCLQFWQTILDRSWFTKIDLLNKIRISLMI